MKLIKVRILGFQSFRDSGDVEFTDGMNLLVGQNNAGKSAVLRSLQPDLIADKHRAPDRWEDYRLPAPEVRLTLVYDGSELQEALLQAGYQLWLPVNEANDGDSFLKALLAKPAISVTVNHRPNSVFTADQPWHGQFSREEGRAPHRALIQIRDAELLVVSGARSGDDSTAQVVHDMWRRHMFFFLAERMNVGLSAIEHAPRLSSNAQNLPAVLLTLSGDRGDVFQKLVRHLREIFPTVGNLSVRPIPGSSNVEVRIWPTEAMTRVELSFPLLQSGTGVAQVISILAAVMTVENAVIVVDEINSFLHPAAVKALLRILQTEYSQHQYIISTHAPEVIGFSNPRTIHIVRREGYESKINELDLAKLDNFREVAEHLGVSMADVFAADRVIWVEGQTEELCFPLLYQQSVGQALPKGTVFTSVMATGDFVARRRDRELVYKIYQRLSQAAVPLVVSVAFSFDSESLTDTEKEEMIRDSRGALNFLPRRHIECYLINPAALADFVIERDNATGAAATEADVERKFIELAASKDFVIAEWNGKLYNEAWLRKVDAANLIAETCAAISEQRVTFNKKRDTLALLQLVQIKDPEQLAELCGYVHKLGQSVTERQD